MHRGNKGNMLDPYKNLSNTKGGRFQSVFFGSGSGSVLAKFRFSVPGSGSVLLCTKAKTWWGSWILYAWKKIGNHVVLGINLRLQNSFLLLFCQNWHFCLFCGESCPFYLIYLQNREPAGSGFFRFWTRFWTNFGSRFWNRGTAHPYGQVIPQKHFLACFQPVAPLK